MYNKDRKLTHGMKVQEVGSQKENWNMSLRVGTVVVELGAH